MDICVQYLEGGSHPVPPTPAEARARLRAAFEILPIEMVLLGWDLSPELVEACAEECQARGAGLFLWHPLLSGRRDLHPAKGWQVVGLNGEPVAGHAGKAEFTFVCPNQPAAREAVLAHLDTALASGWYQGVFLDRIRFPSPAANPERDLGCFCGSCLTSAAEADVDLADLQAQLRSSMRTPEGRRSAVRGLLTEHARNEGDAPQDALDWLLEFRRQSVTHLAQSAAATARARGMLLGLDCYSPTLARMVGQDLAALAAFSDWIKIMTYVRAFGPACIPFEVLGLADWLMTSGAAAEPDALGLLADAAGWPLPATREDIRRGRLPSEILTAEITRGRAAGAAALWAGIELVDLPGVCRPDLTTVRRDARAVRRGSPDGVVLSWDLWFMPRQNLEAAAAQYGPT